ncbi:MAG: DMT family transporter [Proteobacteria bacterium]|nr:DMT family transporter [Pseudomonadota bacterium]
MNPTSPLIAYLALTTASLLWGGSFIAMKYALGTFDPMIIIFGRMAMGFALLLPFAGKIRTACSPRPGDLKLLLFMALCEPCLYFLFEANALQYTSASQAGMITATLPLMVSMAAIPILKEKVSPGTLFGFGLAVAGVAWLSAAGVATEDAPNPVLGNILEVLAMASAVGYIITSKHLSTRYSPLYLTMFMAGAGTICFLPTLLLPGTQIPTSFPLGPCLAVAFLGICVTLGAFFCYNFGVKYLPTSQAAAFVNLIPVFTAFLGWLLLSELFTPQQFAASALVLGGVFISQRKK